MLKLRKRGIIKTLGISVLAAMLVPTNLNVNAAATEIVETFEYTGSQQTYTAPETGYYEIEAFGAKGADYGSYKGGLGGRVKSVIFLKQEQTIYINIGGVGTTSAGGYNGGAATSGSLKYSGGGGATSVSVMSGTLQSLNSAGNIGSVALVAGGGGGATEFKNGGAGGNTSSGTTTIGVGTSGSAGGGGGYYGGNSGNVIYHTHKDGSGTERDVNYQASSSGGCFTSHKYHAHTVNAAPCYEYYHDYRKCGFHEVRDITGYLGDCPGCGGDVWVTLVGNDVDGDSDGKTDIRCAGEKDYDNGWKWRKVCTSSEYNYYALNCGKTAGVTIDTSTASYGGTNYIVPGTVATYMRESEAGVNNGNGKVIIKKVPEIHFNYLLPSTDVSSLDNAETFNAYAKYDATKDVYYIDTFPVPSVEQFTFGGWTTDSNPSASSTVYKTGIRYEFSGMPANTDMYTYWKRDVITITLHDQLGLYYDKSTGEYYTIEQEINTKISTLPTPTSPGYTFNGWYTAETGGTKITSSTTCTFTQNTTLYARWTANKYTVTFNANGGTLSGSSSKTVTFKQPYGDMPTVTKSGYNFLGWQDSNGNIVGSTTPVTIPNNHTLTAQWEERSLNKEFNYTGGWQSWTIPETGYYKIESWGAQGGSYGSYSGGKGGYTHSVFYLTKGTVLNVNVGGSASASIPGYNGGGAAKSEGEYKPAYSTGGGASGVYTNGKDKANLLTMAGGGGGAIQSANGGAGGTTTPGTTTYINGQSGQAGGGGGYYGGSSGYVVLHKHTGSRSGGGGCYGRAVYNTEKCKHKFYHDYVGGNLLDPSETATYPGDRDNDWICYRGSSSHCNIGREHESGGDDPSYTHTVNTSINHYERNCSKTEGVTVDDYVASRGGSNYIASDAFYTDSKAGIRGGNGKVIVTALYEFTFDTNRPTVDVANVAATNEVTILPKSEVKKSTLTIYEPVINNKKELVESPNNSTYTILLENGQKFNMIDGFTEFPQPQLKGWTFEGWHFEQKYKGTAEDKVHSCTKALAITDKFEADVDLPLLGNKLYAHWKENVYYIQYVRNDTTKNIYGDECTSDAIINTKIKKLGLQDFVKDTSKGYYTQKCLYDHEVQVLQNLYTKTGYFFNGWTNKTDNSIVDGSNTKGTGTGKMLGTKYNECEILTPVADGEKFKAGKCNFNYITDAKQHETDISIPKWSYLQSGVTDGSDTIILYATWEPIRYSLQYNGTDNWNTEVKPYKQVVTNEKSVSSNLIRYDQYFTLDANKFTRNAPYTIKSPEGLDVVLKAGYSLTGWGFGQNTRQYSTNPSWNLLQLNTKPDNKQGLLEQDYLDKQASVRNVLSADSIKAIDKYVLDWTNARTATNLSDKTELHNKEIIQNLHAIWRRNSETGGGTTPTPTPTPTPGGSTDPTPTPTPTPGTSPSPSPSTKPIDPTDDNFGIELTFNLNGGYLVDSATKDISYEPIVMKQELFNDYYYEFDIIGNENKDLLNNTVTFDSYGAYSNSNPANNYDSATGLNVKFRKTDKSGNSYRLCGWSTEKGDIVPISPDNKRIVDGITTNNLDVYDISNHNETIQICNDTVLYAIWEPELKLDVRMTRVLGGSSCQSGTLTNANQEYMKSKGIPKLTLNPGEQAKYMISITGEQRGTTPVGSEPSERVIGITVTTQFDPVFTGIYDSGIANIQDSLNRVEPEDLDEPISASSNLNRKWTKQKTGVLTRSFYMPQYLGTNVASQYGYPSFKSDGYTFNVTASRYSNFHKGLEEVTAEFLIVINTEDTPGPGPDPTPTPGGGGDDDDDDDIDDTKPSDVKTTLDELRTKLKIRIN